jgi:hypothetical protein
MLGDCGGGKSGEHYISSGIIDDDSVRVFGFPWCRDEPVTIGKSSAVGNVLCVKHNSALSDFDAEAIKLKEFLRTNVYAPPSTGTKITLNGFRLEKWALKTFINLGYLKGLNLVQTNRLEPPEQIVRYIFRNEPIADGVGLYFVSGKVTDENYLAGMSWEALINAKNPTEVFGMTFAFHGLRFVISTPQGRAEARIAGLGVAKGVDYSKAQIAYRPPNVTFRNGTGELRHIDLQ